MHLKTEPLRTNFSKINEKTHNRSLVDLHGEQVLQFSQLEINFVNIEINELYEISLNIRNVSPNSQKIKIRKPNSPDFTIQTSREGSLAAGLDMKLTVLLDSKENLRKSDKIVVMTQTTETEIPLNIYPLVGKLEFEPFINFGFVRVGATAEASWSITNKGDSGIKFNFDPLMIDQNATLSLSCEEMFLQPGEKKAVLLSLHSKVAGPVEGNIQIEPKTLGYSTMEFSANFCDYSRIISDSEGKEIKQIIVDPLFGGEAVNLSAFVVNNTPESCEYRVTRKKGSGDDNIVLITPEQIGKDDSQKLVQFSPSQGELEAYSSVQVRATVMGKYDEADQQTFCNYILGKSIGTFEKEWTYTLRTHLSQDEQHLDLALKGSSMVPKITLTPTYLEFGSTPMQSKEKKSVQIENFSSKAVSLSFQNSGNYSFHPQKLKIPSKGLMKVEVVFCPKKVGQLNQICCLDTGVFSFPVKLFGKCVFSTKGDHSICEQVPVDDLNRTDLEQEISAIQKGRSSLHGLVMEQSKNSIHFDSYRQATTLVQSEEKSLPFENTKRTRLLRNKNGKQQKFDMTHLNANQAIDTYPSSSKNQQEERLVSKELSSLELRNISVGPVVIDIGTILLRSVQKKYFHICNFNPKPISIRLEAPHESFSQTSEQRQILPGESHGGFPIMFQPLSEGPFKHTLQYVLNGCHFFQLMLTGTCVLPALTLSRNEIKFNISEDDKRFEKKETMKMENAFDYEVSYEWTITSNGQFSIEPAKGAIKPHSSMTTTFVYGFENGGEPGVKIEESAKLKIKYGRNVEIKCSALIPESHCVCKSQEIQFKEVAIGRTAECKVLIKNMSKIDTIYKVNIPREIDSILSITTRTGSILSEEMTELCFKLTSPKTLLLDSVVQISIKGSKNFELPVKANVILPKVYVENEEIDFGSVPVEGNPGEKQITLVNDSNISVDLELRLLNDTFLAKSLRLGEILDGNMQIIETKELKPYKVIYLRVAPKCKTVFTVLFFLETADEYEFYLPLFIPTAEPMDELQKICRCKGIKNKLMAINKEVSFGKIVIEQAQQTYSKNQILEIFNPQDEPISWWVDENGIAPFKLDRKSGRLQGFEKYQIKIFFSAETPGEYSRELKFFIDQTDSDISRCYMKVDIKAEACYPTLYFDHPYLILPTVRCGELSTSVLEIHNGGYQNINLKHSVSQEFSNIDLRVRYLTGSNLGVTRKQIKVQVSFVSEKPVSFTVKLNFFDNSGRAFSINISGTADTHTFTLINQEKIIGSEASSLEKSCQFVRYYINSTGQLPDELYSFPKSLMENEFEKLSLLLSNYSISFDKAKSQVKKNYKSFLAFEYISEIIKILKADGAFLNHIRPEMLLPFEEYTEYIKIRAEDNLTILSHYKKKEKEEFEVKHKQSWLILFYQIFKVFSRINPGKTKNNSQFWSKFQIREKLLLSWLEKTYLTEASIELQSKGNELLSTMNSCELLTALISKYTNIKILEYYGKGVKGQKEKERRCKSVIDTFAQIGINCLFRLEDLLRSSEKEMMLVLENLYMILPSYLQKGEPIVFSCQFGQIVSKSVEITNPSKHQLGYMAKIEGCKAYSIEGEPQFLIDSKKTHEVKIKYVSNINMNNSSATLTLTGKANNKFTPSTFIFVLKSNNLGRISEKAVQVNANLYQQLDFNLKVTNNFAQDCEFKIEMVTSSKSVYSSFYLPVSAIKIKKGETLPLGMIFIPFTLETQQVLLIFRDEKVGEFQYEVNGLVESNILCQEVLRVPQNLFTNKRYTIELPIPTKNDLVYRARKAAEFLADRLEKRSLVKDPKQAPQPVNYNKYYPKLASLETFSAKLGTLNNSIILKTPELTIKDVDQGEEPSKDQKLVFEINMKAAIKEGSFTVNLKNATGTDIRKYKICLTAISRPLRYELEMKTPANRPISQPLPLINLSNEKNTFHVSMVPNNDHSRAVFSIDCEREVSVEPQEQQLINLCFRPKQESNYSAFLKVENVSSGQHVEYEIVGISEQPETETINFEQEVRKEKNYSIKLPTSKLARCTVQTFDLENVQYSKTFQCSAEHPNFRFKICPKMSGRVQGKLIIEADQNIYAYKIVINVKNTIQGEVKMRTIERKEVTADIPLPVGSYRVLCDDFNLKFEETVLITEETPAIPIRYYSSKPEEKEIYLTLVSDNLGELTYLIKVIVDPMPEIKMEPFQVELGKMHKEKVVFENTDEVPMTVICKSTHPAIFSSEHEKFTVPARSNFTTYLVYRASSLEIEEGKLYFSSDRNAKWAYHLSGYGLPQSKPEIKQMVVSMGEHLCQPITFRNPLNKTIPYFISLENTQGDAFSVILKSNKVDLAYNQELQIPVTVKPTSVTLNTAILKIYVNQKICWRYELKARTIFRSEDEPKVFKIESRAKAEQVINLPLPFSQNYNGQTLTLNIVSQGEGNNHFVRNVIKIAGGNQAVVEEQRIKYVLNILSFVPKNILTYFEVCAKNGCKWIYKVRFHFTPPPVDDEMIISTGINKPASFKFKLTNRIKSFAKFHAYFSSNSCIDFTICPKNGELEPYGREGTPIEVIFCPTQYKKSWTGKLIIQTEESYWSYDIKGSLPHYTPPIGVSTLKQ